MSNVIMGFVPAIIVTAALAVLYTPLGNYVGRVFATDKHLGIRRSFYRAIGARPGANQHWTKYTASVLSFSIVNVIFVYLLQRTQQ